MNLYEVLAHLYGILFRISDFVSVGSLDLFKLALVHPALEDRLERVDVIDGAGFRLENSSLENALFSTVQQGEFQGDIAHLNT